MNRAKSVNIVFFATVLLSILGAYINSWILKNTNNYFLVLLTSQVFLIIPTIIYLIYYKLNIWHAIRFHKIKISNVILLIIFSYLITPIMNLINMISMLFVKNDTTDFINNIVTNNKFLLSLFMVALIPGIFEEVVYRGIFYNEYRKISPLRGILLSGFLFGIIHLNLNQFSYAFAMGIIFALLIEATNSILASMIVHFFINGSSVLIMELYPKLLRLLETLYGKEQFNVNEMLETVGTGVDTVNLSYLIQSYSIFALFMTLLAFVVYRVIAKNSGRWEYVKGIFQNDSVTDPYLPEHTSNTDILIDDSSSDIQKRDNGRLISWSLIISIIICLGLMILGELG